MMKESSYCRVNISLLRACVCVFVCMPRVRSQSLIRGWVSFQGTFAEEAYCLVPLVGDGCSRGNERTKESGLPKVDLGSLWDNN